MNFDYEKRNLATTLIAIGGFGITLVVAGLWDQRTLAGKTALMEAESTSQVRVLEAKAEFEFVEGEWRVKHAKCNVWGDVMWDQQEENN